MRLRQLGAGLSALILASSLTACGSGGGVSADQSKPLKVIADVIPHAELIKEAQNLGLITKDDITVTEISGNIDPNQLVESGDLDANFFQHVPYLNDWNKAHGDADLVSVATVHIEPLGLYSKKVSSLTDIPEGAVIAIPSDATNQARALFLLEDAGLITLDVKRDDPNLDYAQVSEKNVVTNDKKISFLLIERPQLAATLDDPKVNLAVINGNYALEAGLVPLTDALILEKAENNPYANVLVVKKDLADDARVQKLVKALESPELATYITENYQGSVLPAKG